MSYGEGFHNVPLAVLQSSPTNPRKTFDAAALRDLTESVSAKGVIVPLLVRPISGAAGDRLEIVAGERRFRAAQAANLPTVPVQVRSLTDDEAIEVQIIENLQREEVHFLEEAIGYHELRQRRGLDPKEIAARVGKEPVYVAQRMRLAHLSDALRKMCFDGALPVGAALELARLDAHQQQEIRKSWVFRAGEEVSVARIRDYIRHEVMLDLHGAAWPKDDATLIPAVGACSDCPKRAGNQPLLFPDIRKGDTCTDPRCFAAKQDAWIARLRAENPKAPRIYTAWESKPAKGVLTGREFRRIGGKKDRCDHQQPAIALNGKEAGQLVQVCCHPACKTHFGRGAAVPDYRRAEYAQAKKKKQEKKFRRAVLAKMVQAAGQGGTLLERDLCAGLLAWIEDQGSETLKIIDGALGRDDSEKITAAELLDNPGLRAQLLVALTHAHDALIWYDNPAEGRSEFLEAARERWGVDTDAIAAEHAAKPKAKAKKRGAA